jgi:DNA-binding transcriptional MerR regulator
MRVSDVARRLHISASWLRRLERAGRVPAPARDLNGHRRYTDADVHRLKLTLVNPRRQVEP